MANRWCDGLARYGGDKALMLNGSSGQAWAQVDNGFSLSSANPRTGTHCLRLGSGFSTAQIVRRVFGTALDEVFLGYAIFAHELPVHEPILGGGTLGNRGLLLAGFQTAPNQRQLSVYLGTDGALVAYEQGYTNGSTFTGTLVGRSDPVIGAGAYQHIEFHPIIDGANGALEVRVDEVTRLNLSGLNTDSFGSGEASQFVLGNNTGGVSLASPIDFADFFVNDTTDDQTGANTWVGDCKSSWRRVSADTAQADFTKSTGSVGFDLIDDTPPDDATHIATGASNARSDFGFVDGPTNASEIIAVRPAVRAWKTDAGTATINPSIVTNGNKASVSAQPISTMPSYYDSNVPLNPTTGAPFTPTELDAALEVIERAA